MDAIDTGIRNSVDRLRRRMCREALDCAHTRLQQWVARGVEWYQARWGWILLCERTTTPEKESDANSQPARATSQLEQETTWLVSIPRATVRSRRKKPFRIRLSGNSFAAHVLKNRKGDYCNDLQNEARGFCRIESGARSAIAVPLFDERGHEGGEVIGVYLLESHNPEAFFSGYVQELQKNVAMFTPDLLVLQKYYQADELAPPWIWHPQVHGWSLGNTVERFCHAVVHGAARKFAPQPTCTIWNVDRNDDLDKPASEGQVTPRPTRCWALGTCGYDHEFQDQLALDEKTLTYEMSQLPQGRGERDTLENTNKFYNVNKAKRMGVHEFYIGSLRNDERRISGTINLYALHKSTVLPGNTTLKWLCRQTSDLLADLFDSREKLGIAYVNGQMAKAAKPTPDPGVLLRALLKVLPSDAVSLFVHRPKEKKLVLIDSTGFEGDRSKKVEFPVVEQGPQDSITAHSFKQSRPVRINFPSELDAHIYGIPEPRQEQYWEAVRYGDSDPRYRRRLGVAVQAPVASNAEGDSQQTKELREGVGVIRMYRSGVGRPFAATDAELIAAVASMPKCRRLFQNWAIQRSADDSARPLLDPDIPIPPSRSIYSELQQFTRDLEPIVRQSCFYVWRGTGYEEFACYPPRETPPKTTVFKPSSEASDGINHNEGFPRAWVRMNAWSNDHLLRTVLVIDCVNDEEAINILGGKQEIKEIDRALMRIVSRLTTNVYYPDPSLQTSDRIVDDFQAYVVKKIGMPAESGISNGDDGNRNGTPIFDRAICRLGSHESKLHPNSDWWCPDSDLFEYGVRVNPDGSECWIPLRTGRWQTAGLTCKFVRRYAERMGEAIAYGEKFRKVTMPDVTPHDPTWRQLRRGLSEIVGAWNRIVAPIIDQSRRGSK